MPRERLLERMRADEFLGVHLALSIFVGSTLLWLLRRVIAALNPIWAVASLVAASSLMEHSSLTAAEASLRRVKASLNTRNEPRTL